MAEIPTPRSDFEAFRSLGNPVILQILDVLVQGGQMGPTIIAKKLGVSKPAVSKALALFKQLGLVDDNGGQTKNKTFFISRAASAEERTAIATRLEEALQILADASNRIIAVIENPQTDREAIFIAVQNFTTAAARVSNAVHETIKPAENLSA